LEGGNARNLQDLPTWCCNYLKKNITLTNFSEITLSLISKQDEYFRDIRYFILDWITENYFKIYQEQNQSLRLCEEFLVKNIEVETFVKISKFIAEKTFKTSYTWFMWEERPLAHRQKEDGEARREAMREAKREGKEIFKRETMKLRDAMYCFMQENFEEIKEETIANHLPENFLMGMVAHILPNLNRNKSLSLNKDQENEEAKQGDIGENDDKENVKNGQTRGRKRREPIQKENEASEKPELKKTKKCENCEKSQNNNFGQSV